MTNHVPRITTCEPSPAFLSCRHMKLCVSCAILLFAVAGVCLGFDEPEPVAQKTSQLFNDNLSPRVLFELGGWTMWPVLLTTMVGILFVLERALMLRRSRHLPPDFHKTIIKVVDTRGVDSALAL